MIRIGSIVLRVDDLQRQTEFWEAALGYVRRDSVKATTSCCSPARRRRAEPPPRRPRPCTDDFVMVGKCFKGLTDELPDVADEAAARARDRPPRERVLVRPELVVEIALDGRAVLDALRRRRSRSALPA